MVKAGRSLPARLYWLVMKARFRYMREKSCSLSWGCERECFGLYSKSSGIETEERPVYTFGLGDRAV
jgi:hypothetical protein